VESKGRGSGTHICPLRFFVDGSISTGDEDQVMEVLRTERKRASANLAVLALTNVNLIAGRIG